MNITIFLIDPVPVLTPYTYELDALRKAGGELVIGNCDTPEDVIQQAGDAEILMLSWKRIVTPSVMDALPNVRMMMRWGVGYDQFDTEAAAARGIAVCNTPKYASEDVAEHAIALLFACVRRVPWFDARMHRGEWSAANTHRIHRMAGRTLGLVGIGRIGSAVARRANGLGLRVLAHDPGLDDATIRARGAEPRAMQALLAESDYVSVHVPLGPRTRHLIGRAQLAQMKPGAMLINTSRGPVIDEAALTDVLRSGQLACAGLDVFEQEPLAANSALRGLDNAVLTPHTAAYSEEAWFALRVEACEVAADWIRDSWSPAVVNPQVRAMLRPRR